MSLNYTVKDIVCDYGVYENDKLSLICNGYQNALLIAEIMKKDCSREAINTGKYNFTKEDCIKFFEDREKEREVRLAQKELSEPEYEER